MKCENCNNDFHILEMTTYEDMKVCKICKVKLIQSKRTKLFYKNTKKNILTKEQQDFIIENKDKLMIPEMSIALDLKEHIIEGYLRENKITKKRIVRK